MKRTIGIDQGTTATKAVLLAEDGSVAQLAPVEHAQMRPRDGWVEHDPEVLLEHVRAYIDAAGGADAIGIANQGETVVAWDAESGRPLAPAIVWQDTRTRDRVNALSAEGNEALTLERAGLPLDPYFSATKLGWLVDHAPGARALLSEGRLRLGTTDAFFLERLTGTFATDVTTASRTSLMNLRTRAWDPELCDLFGVPIEALPPIRPTASVFGTVRVGGREVPVTASVVDQQAALFGHGCRRPGLAKVTFGTGAFALAPTGPEPRTGTGPLPTLAWWLPAEAPTYALEGGVYTAAAAVNWARSVGLFTDFDELEGFEGPTALERGLVFVPALSGLGCPYWDPTAAGTFLGIGLATTRHDLLRALLEGVALRGAQVLSAVEAAAGTLERVSIDGGMSKNAFFCQLFADASGREIAVASVADFTALGTAQLAMLGAGFVPTAEALPGTPPPRARIAPRAPLSAELRERFAAAAERSRSWR